MRPPEIGLDEHAVPLEERGLTSLGESRSTGSPSTSSVATLVGQLSRRSSFRPSGQRTVEKGGRRQRLEGFDAVSQVELRPPGVGHDLIVGGAVTGRYDAVSICAFWSRPE